MSEPKEKRLSREEAAKLEISRTAHARPLGWMLAGLFLAAIFAVPAVQLARERAAARAGRLAWTPVGDLLHAPARAWRAARAEPSARLRAVQFNRGLLAEIKSWETELEENSWLTRAVLPRMQAALASVLGVGNEKAYLGRGGWLFYRPGIEYVTGPGFLDPHFQKLRAAAHDPEGAPLRPDPLAAIAQFRDELAARGVRLVLVPVPDKCQLLPEKFAASGRFKVPLQNASWPAFAEELKRRGIDLFDPSAALAAFQAESNAPAYLETDTHWTPPAMERVAVALAAHLEQAGALGPAAAWPYRREAAAVTNRGDLAVMLKLPPGRGPAPEGAALRQVVNDRGELWVPDRRAEVLLLGDSFCNIYSLGAMGWGVSAGLAEQLSFALQRPVDRLARNDSGAFATREMLARELQRGRDRLAGKKVVVWEFAARELSSGNWKPVELRLGTKPASAQFLAVGPGRTVRLAGTVEAVSAVPRAGRVPYKDHIMTVHLSDLELDGAPAPGREAVVCVFSMRDNVWTRAAGWRPGDRVRLAARAWEGVAAKYESINRSELDDAELMLAEPLFGEPEERKP